MPLGRQNSRVLTVRLPDVLYNHLVYQATRREVSLSEAFRLELEQNIERQPDLPIEGNAPGDSGLSYRSFLGMADFSAAIDELETGDTGGD